MLEAIPNLRNQCPQHFQGLRLRSDLPNQKTRPPNRCLLENPSTPFQIISRTLPVPWILSSTATFYATRRAPNEASHANSNVHHRCRKWLRSTSCILHPRGISSRVPCTRPTSEPRRDRRERDSFPSKCHRYSGRLVYQACADIFFATKPYVCLRCQPGAYQGSVQGRSTGIYQHHFLGRRGGYW